MIRTEPDLTCANCSQQQPGSAGSDSYVVIPPGRTDTQLRQALQEYAEVHVLHFSDPVLAFKDFADTGMRDAFQVRNRLAFQCHSDDASHNKLAFRASGGM